MHEHGEAVRGGLQHIGEFFLTPLAGRLFRSAAHDDQHGAGVIVVPAPENVLDSLHVGRQGAPVAVSDVHGIFRSIRLSLTHDACDPGGGRADHVAVFLKASFLLGELGRPAHDGQHGAGITVIGALEDALHGLHVRRELPFGGGLTLVAAAEKRVHTIRRGAEHVLELLRPPILSRGHGRGTHDGLGLGRILIVKTVQHLFHFLHVGRKLLFPGVLSAGICAFPGLRGGFLHGFRFFRFRGSFSGLRPASGLRSETAEKLREPVGRLLDTGAVLSVPALAAGFLQGNVNDGENVLHPVVVASVVDAVHEAHVFGLVPVPAARAFHGGSASEKGVDVC